MSGIIIPGGSLGRREKDVQALTRDEMITVMRMHDICQRHNIGLFCPRCSEQFQGANTGHERYMSITCKCREIRADMGPVSGVN